MLVDEMAMHFGRRSPKAAGAVVEELAYRRCADLDGAAASLIAAIDLVPYREEIRSHLEQIAQHPEASVKAVYWEFDPDNGWSSAFFACSSYRPESDDDDGWAADFDDAATVTGPSMPELADLRASTWTKTPADAARNAFLVARTVAAIGWAASEWSSRVPLTAGYHDQSRVFRVRSTR
jgi:hypothetical protein